MPSHEAVHPDVTVLNQVPRREDVRQWLEMWRAVQFVYGRRWRFGIIRTQVQQADGTWVLQVECASDDPAIGVSMLLWVVHRGPNLVAVEARRSLETGPPDSSALP